MKICRFNNHRLGLVEGEQVRDVTAALDSLLPGDLIYTDTPKGVGPVVPGDVIVTEFDGIGRMEVAVTAAKQEAV